MFPILSAAPPPGEEDPEDEENDTEGDSENPKHFAVQVGPFTRFTAFTHSPCTHLTLSQSNIYDMCSPVGHWHHGSSYATWKALQPAG